MIVYYIVTTFAIDEIKIKACKMPSTLPSVWTNHVNTLWFGTFYTINIFLGRGELNCPLSSEAHGNPAQHGNRIPLILAVTFNAWIYTPRNAASAKINPR